MSSTTTRTKPEDTFLELFRELEGMLRRVLHIEEEHKFREFRDLVRRVIMKVPSLARQESALLDISKIRSIVVHGEIRVGRVIPTEETLKELRDALTAVQKVGQIISNFVKNIRVFPSDAPLVDALKFMHAENFSQVAVKNSHELLDVLTAVDIAEWLAGKVDKNIIEIAEYAISDVLKDTTNEKFSVIKRTATVADVEEMFLEAAHRYYPGLFCIFITNSGKRTERPIGIVTPYDLLPRISL